MKLKFPLYSKFLVWLLLNLILLALVAGFFVAGQFQFGMDMILSGRAGDRLQTAAGLVAVELRSASREDWDEILARHSEAYGVRFILARWDGRQIAGAQVELPPEMREKFRSPLGRFRGPPRDPTPDFQRRPDPGRAGPRFSRPPRPAFLVRTTNPTRYWAGVPITLRAEDGERGGPAMLLVVSETLHAGGLIFDVKPLLTAALVALGVSIAFWFPLVRGITHSITATRRATEQIAEGRFTVRAPAHRRDEIGALGQAVNTMAQRLEGHVNGQKRFLGDVAHELCSPIARMEVALAILERQQTSTVQADYLKDVREELEQMSRLVGELLAFSKASFGASAAQLGPVNVRECIETAVATENKNGAAVVIDTPAEIVVRANAGLLTRALSNLVRNAILYAGQAGPVTITARAEAPGIVISIADQGSGVPDEGLPRLFEPFYRVDSARARETGGTGLGMTIVKTCVEACGGTVTARNRAPHGLEVTLTLHRV